MTPFLLRREFPAPSMAVFFALQALDVVTTLIGVRMGASEGSLFVGRLMGIGPLAGLLIAKFFALLLAGAAMGFKRPRVVVFLNYWFCAIVSWNLLLILSVLFRCG